ncbi:prepilin peptidase [Planktotalea sp.]|uniref:prepilin peptidase n=1 Tax=Planktotalea sp. TaxID=2029877 RepID=UPI003D6B7B0A
MLLDFLDIDLTNSARFALWSLPFILPICFLVAWSDMRAMRIPNWCVLVMFGVYIVIGVLTLPFTMFLWGFVSLLVVLFIGFFMNAVGMIGAGDAKFAAAAAPFIAMSDFRFVIALFAANILAAFMTHRMVAKTKMTGLAPSWDSWERTWEFPMGLSLGGTLAIYLILSALTGV